MYIFEKLRNSFQFQILLIFIYVSIATTDTTATASTTVTPSAADDADVAKVFDLTLRLRYVNHHIFALLKQEDLHI